MKMNYIAEKGWSCIFIDAPGLLWSEDNGGKQEIQLCKNVLEAIVPIVVADKREIVLLVDDLAGCDQYGIYALFEHTPFQNRIRTILQVSSERQKVTEIIEEVEKNCWIESFAIFSKEHLDRYFPRQAVYIANGEITEENLKKAETILNRIDSTENFYLKNRGKLSHHAVWRNGPRKVIFLDIDGVLNQDNGGLKIEEQFVKRLARIVEATDAEIILLSSWRGAFTRCIDPKNDYENKDVELLISTLEKYLLCIAGTTPDLASGPYARPLEIRTWLQEQAELERFVILDDETFWSWNWLSDYLVCTTHVSDDGKSECGLTDEDVEKAINILNCQ